MTRVGLGAAGVLLVAAAVALLMRPSGPTMSALGGLLRLRVAPEWRIVHDEPRRLTIERPGDQNYAVMSITWEPADAERTITLTDARPTVGAMIAGEAHVVIADYTTMPSGERVSRFRVVFRRQGRDWQAQLLVRPEADPAVVQQYRDMLASWDWT